ncbi:protein artemis-like [Leptidea sinapis]|uniref:protein artemis-like n=1 Tax=Leptidea sinapis TaxID=189913 RepID=UPI0021C2A470|nr:protein artemis-like [Leptidea sinapis]
MNQYSMSAFHGKIEEIPGIHVDNFENASVTKPRAFFLSHCHSDHIQGLHSNMLLNYLLNNNIFIYTSELSAAIINDEKKDERIMNFVKVLKLGKQFLIPFLHSYSYSAHVISTWKHYLRRLIPWSRESCATLITIPQRDQEVEELVTVTLIPAAHSAGSVMFLFQTVSTTVLYTGDFRMNTSDIHRYAALNSDGPIKIDSMYVDTTFIDLKYENFPKRSYSIEKMIAEIAKWLSRGGVALHTSAKYGYEFVFNEIYRSLAMKVYVNEERWRFYR